MQFACAGKFYSGAEFVGTVFQFSEIEKGKFSLVCDELSLSPLNVVISRCCLTAKKCAGMYNARAASLYFRRRHRLRRVALSSCRGVQAISLIGPH